MKQRGKKLSEDDIRDRYRYPPFPEKFTVKSIIAIVCPVHGEFRQSIEHHMNGQGCRVCARLKASGVSRVSRAEWIRRFESAHGRGKYSYSKVPENVRQNTRIEIFCPEHNVSFYQTPVQHWRFRQGCPKCGAGRQWEKRKRDVVSRREFERRARAVHGLAFEYTELPLEFSLNDSVIIYCNEHNHIFFCVARDHLNGKGCDFTSGASQKLTGINPADKFI